MQNIVVSQTRVNRIAHEQIITYKQQFAGHPVSCRPMKIFWKQKIAYIK